MQDLFYEAVKDTDSRIYAQVQLPYSGRLHFHRAFEIAYIMEGSAHYFVENEEFTADADHIVFCHCYYRHRSALEPYHKKIVIAVPENLSHDISLLFKNTSLPAHLPDAQFNQQLRPYFETLVACGEDTPQIILKGYLNLIFGSLASHYHNIVITPKNKNVSIIVDILDYINLHCAERLTLESLAREFGYNKSYFSRLFNKCIGISLNNYINLARLNRYESLLHDGSNENVTDLIYKAGFQSAATFYRVKGLREQANRDTINL